VEEQCLDCGYHVQYEDMIESKPRKTGWYGWVTSGFANTEEPKKEN
jgi:hypothetical protein